MSKEQVIESILRDGVRKIILSRPKKKNAFNKHMYQKLTQILKEDSQNDNVVLTIITGAGDFYSSGNDFKDNLGNGFSLDDVQKLIEALIEYPKVIIAVLNGPAIGIAATTTALCDIVYASDRAYLDTPFVHLCLCAEGTSSYMFPRILGRSKASEAIFLGKKITSQDAYRLGFISEVIPHEQLPAFIESLYQYGSLSTNSIKISKRLVMEHLKKQLFRASELEIEGLNECMNSEKFTSALMKFMEKKSKL
ncbi:enoyl-CoA delta isomerase 3, peroxisomal-like isoform X1 [Euwallacea fornicatus]|uniref:enoyl-CoA delta isomerase 3, peroxisomal-like isoform X1 n=1 Tax=Euwallacea fornicatus TaxID=995702 RepID=UPI0033905ED9